MSSHGVSVIIPSFDGRELLASCLPPLIAALRDQAQPHEIIVSDDGSDDGTAEWLSEAFPEVRVARSETNTGFQGAVARGLAAARHDLVYFLNNDIQVQPGFLTPLVRCLDDPRVFAAASREVLTGQPDETADRLPVVRFRLGFWWHRYEEVEPRLKEKVPVLFVTMGHGLFRRRMLDELGFLDPRFEPFYFEDQDLCFRAWSRGWECLYEPASMVTGGHQATIGRLHSRRTVERIHWRNRFLFQWKNLRGARYRVRELFWLPPLAVVAPLIGKGALSAGLFSAIRARRTLPSPPREDPSPGGFTTEDILAMFRRLPQPVYRILFLHDQAIIGGAEKSMLLLASGLDRRRFEPLFAIGADGPFRQLLAENGMRTVGCRLPSLHGLRLDRWVLHSWRLARWMRRHGIDLVHGNTPRSNLYAWLAGRLARIPVVWQMRNVLEDGMRDVERILQWAPDAILCNSGAVASRFRPAARVHVVYTGVDTQRYSPLSAEERAETRSTLGIVEDQVAVGIAGRIGYKQGHEVLLRAARVIAEKRPQARFFVIGSAQFSHEHRHQTDVQALAADLGLEGSVTFLGHRDDMDRVLSAMDILAHPSWFEAFSRTVLEAMACGTPVIGSRVGGIPEAVEDGVTGRLVEPGNPEALAQALLELIDDPGKRRAWSEASRRRAVSEFPVARTVQETSAAYLDLLEAAGDPGQRPVPPR